MVAYLRTLTGNTMTDLKKLSQAKTFIGMLQFQARILNNVFDNLPEEAALKRVSSNANHINWLAGHILHCRFMLAGMIGINETNPFGQTYWLAIDDKAYPGVKEIAAQIPHISEQLIEKLSSLSDDEMDTRPSGNKQSLGEIIAFFVYHESYHLGQIGIVRKIIGLGALKSS
jgi:uncharacterized damage-inducible protein DinB